MAIRVPIVWGSFYSLIRLKVFERKLRNSKLLIRYSIFNGPGLFISAAMYYPQEKTMAPNRLINEKSPYLLQHAHNPVDWHAWSEETFALAKTQNKPVFISIGYATCHWCHVME
ncbi:MAG: DUF255 domain-containing protein, partial [Desulfobacterales bacterium]